MSDSYKLVVIGAGSGGVAAAEFAATLGVPAALIEKHRVGGDCTWFGCVPSKALIHAGKVAHTVRTAASVGIHTDPPTIDFGRAMQYVRDKIAEVYATETPEVFEKKGVDVILGAARFLDAHTLAVGDRRIEAEKILISTGGRARVPAIPGIENVPYLTNETVFDLTERPKRLIVIGSGPIGCEIAQAMQRLGCQVTLLDTGDRILRVNDDDAAVVVERQFLSEGIDIRYKVKIQRIDQRGTEIAVALPVGEIVGDAVLVATGRQPNIEGLDLEKGGIAYTDRGIQVDDKLQTTAKGVYACGDVIGSYQFTHYAGWQAAFAVRNALLPGASKALRDTVPSVTYTQPEIGQVGLSEQAAKRAGIGHRVWHWAASRIDRAVTENETEGFIKLIAAPDGKLLGATVVASAASDMINELAVAHERGLTLKDLATIIHVYPTFGFAIQQAAAEGYYEQLVSGFTGRIVKGLARR